MKIVYCIGSFGAGGVEQVTVFKANALAEKGNEVWIIYTDAPLAGGFHKPSGKVRLIDLNVRYNDNYLRFPWNYVWAVRAMKRHKRLLTEKLREIKPDIVISTGKAEKYFLGKIKGPYKTILEIHLSKGRRENESPKLINKVLAPFADWVEFHNPLRLYDRVVVLTRYEKEKAWNNNPKVEVIPNPLMIQPDSIVNPSSSDNKRIVAIGRLDYGKNYLSLVRAFASISSLFPEWSLDIYGKGPEQEQILDLISHYQLEGRITLRGFMPDIAKELSDASLLVHTSRYESFGMVLLEAMSCGVPVIAYDCPYGPRSLISNEEDGLLVPFGDEDVLSGAMSRMMKDDTLRRQMGETARINAKKYELVKILPLWENLFETLSH